MIGGDGIILTRRVGEHKNSQTTISPNQGPRIIARIRQDTADKFPEDRELQAAMLRDKVLIIVPDDQPLDQEAKT